jgi:hypothetical protein
MSMANMAHAKARALRASAACAQERRNQAGLQAELNAHKTGSSRKTRLASAQKRHAQETQDIRNARKEERQAESQARRVLSDAHARSKLGQQQYTGMVAEIGELRRWMAGLVGGDPTGGLDDAEGFQELMFTLEQRVAGAPSAESRLDDETCGAIVELAADLGSPRIGVEGSRKAARLARVLSVPTGARVLFAVEQEGGVGWVLTDRGLHAVGLTLDLEGLDSAVFHLLPSGGIGVGEDAVLHVPDDEHELLTALMLAQMRS